MLNIIKIVVWYEKKNFFSILHAKSGKESYLFQTVSSIILSGSWT